MWKILGIEETKDLDLIKEAYRKKLVEVNPEDDPEGFKTLRTSYEEAMEWAKTAGEDEKDSVELTEFDIWVKKVESTYRDFFQRINLSNWQELLQEDICISLDTASEARDRLLTFLMDNFRLPSKIWKEIETSFHIIEDKSELYERFPKDYIDFIIRSIKNEEFPDYSLFGGDGDEDFDGFISSYFQLKACIDEGNTENFESLYTACKDYFVEHPYVLVEEARYYIGKKEYERASEILGQAHEAYFEDNYILYYICDLYLKTEDYEKAKEQYTILLEREPKHYSGLLGMAQCYIANEEYEKARDIYYDVLEMYQGDSYVTDKLEEINDNLIEKFQTEYEKDGSNIKAGLELGWCLCRGGEYEKTLELLEGMNPTKEHELEYHNLKGRTLLYHKDYENAIKYLKKWVEEMEAITPDDTIETHKKIRRIGYAYYAIGCAYAELSEENLETALEYIAKAIQKEKDDYGRLNYKNQEAFYLFKLERYEQCIEVCDKIIEESEQYYPAFVRRQEAYYKLKHYQEVIDDYYRAVDIYAKDETPYTLAIKTFVQFDKYEDAKEILDRAKQEEVTCDQLVVYEAKITRMLAKSQDDVVNAYELLTPLKESQNKLERVGDAWYEGALCKYDLGDFDVALEEVNEAIKLLPSEDDYIYTKANILFEQREYAKAKSIYENMVDNYPNSDTLLFKMGRVNDMLGDIETAVSYYLKALELYPEHGGANYYLAFAYENLGDDNNDKTYYEKALEYFTKLIEINPNEYNLNDRGLLYAKIKRFDEAIADYEKVFEYNEQSPYPYNNMGVVYKFRKQYEEAISCFLKAIEYMGEYRNLNTYVHLAATYSTIGEFEKAEKYYIENVRVFADSEDAYQELAEFYRRRKQFDKAIDVYNDAKDRLSYMEESEYFTKLAETYAEAESKKAEAFYKKAIKKNPNSPEVYASYGEYYFYGKLKYKQALSYYEKANQLLNNDNHYLHYENVYNIGKVYYYLDNKDKARKSMEQVIDYYNRIYGSLSQYMEDTVYGTVRMYRVGLMYYYMGEVEKARELFLQMNDSIMCRNCKFPKCYEAMIGEGLILESQGKTDEALGYYKEALKLESDMYCYFLINRLTKKSRSWFK